MILRNCLLIILIFVLGVMVGCSEEKHSVATHAVAVKNTLWVKRQNLEEFVDAAINNYDSSKIQQMIGSKKIFVVHKDTEVVRSDTKLNKEIVSVTFLEGAYREQTGYAPSSQIVPIE